MNYKYNLLRLLAVLAPLLVLVAAIQLRFKRLPEWIRDAYPYALWSLMVAVVVLAVAYLVLNSRKRDENAPLIWSVLVMAVAFAIFYFLDSTGTSLPGMSTATVALIMLGVFAFLAWRTLLNRNAPR